MDTFKDKDIKNKQVKFNFVEEGEYCKLDYYDNAGGLDEQTFNSLFDSSFSFSNEKISTKLHMTKFVVENFDGEIKANNLENCVHFKLYLPKNSNNI